MLALKRVWFFYAVGLAAAIDLILFLQAPTQAASFAAVKLLRTADRRGARLRAGSGAATRYSRAWPRADQKSPSCSLPGGSRAGGSDVSTGSVSTGSAAPGLAGSAWARRPEAPATPCGPSARTSGTAGSPPQHLERRGCVECGRRVIQRSHGARSDRAHSSSLAVDFEIPVGSPRSSFVEKGLSVQISWWASISSSWLSK